MPSKLTGRKHLHDNVVRARRAASPRQQRVTIISGGVKYGLGKPPAQVCPAGSAPRRPMMARPLGR